MHRSDYFGLSSISVVHALKHMISFNLKESISVQHQRNQKTSSCSVQYQEGIDKAENCASTLQLAAICICCDSIERAFNVPGLFEQEMFQLKCQCFSEKQVAGEQIVKSKLKCPVGALGKSSRAGGLCWPGAGSPEPPSWCHLPHSKGQKAAHLLFLGSSSMWCSPDASDS